ncbi:MAG: hypothetical protein NXI32_15160 [bacterium]|nr:hypothetical protein [bacterium]
MRKMTDQQRALWAELINLLADYLRAVITNAQDEACRIKTELADRWGIKVDWKGGER